MNKSKSKYFNTASLMDQALLLLLEKSLLSTLQSKKYAKKPE